MHCCIQSHDLYLWTVTLVQLKHFIAIAELGSFSRSAEKLHITQPALSRSIRALEDQLRGPLFDRVGRNNELTPLGNELVERARRILLEADDLLDFSKAMDSGASGPVRIGLGSTPGAILTEPLLKHFSHKDRATKLILARGVPPMLMGELQNRRLDLLVVEVSALPASVDLTLEYLQPMQPGFFCRPGHPLRRKRGRVTIAQLAQYPVASTRLSDHVARDLTEIYGPRAHPDALINVNCEEIAPLLNVARQSDTVVLTMKVAAAELRGLDMAPRMPKVAQFVIASMRGRSESRAIAAARQLISDRMHD